MRQRWTLSVFDKFNIMDRQKQANYYSPLVVSTDISPKGKNKCTKTKVAEEETEDI